MNSGASPEPSLREPARGCLDVAPRTASESRRQPTISLPVPFLTAQTTPKDKSSVKRKSSHVDNAGDATEPPSKRLKQEHSNEQRQSGEMKRLKAVDVNHSVFRTEVVPERRTRSGMRLEAAREASPRCSRKDGARSEKAKPPAKSSRRTLPVVDMSTRNRSTATPSETGAASETLSNVHAPEDSPAQPSTDDDEMQRWVEQMLSDGTDPNYVHVPTQHEKDLANHRAWVKEMTGIRL